MHRMRTLVTLAMILILAGFATAAADEGMWPLYDLNKLDLAALKARGLQLTPEQIFNEKDGGIAAAIVQVGGGTGSFVSPDGLIITNHHVAFGAIQQQSSVNQNYVRDGFWAKTRTEEIPAIGYQAFITKSFRDVTKEILSAVRPGMSDLERYKAIDKKRSEIVKREEAKGDIRCRIATFHSGLQYYLVTSFRIQDVRIVYIPPQAIGEFGGEIDNWMWPRHTGDFSFLRAYVAPDGKSAIYSDKNVPYKSTTFLPISSGPRAEGDLALMIGYPGGTYRYRDSYSINEHVNYNHPNNIKDFSDIIGILEEASRADSMAAIKVSGTIKGLNNALKNSQGMLRGLRRANLLEIKRKRDADLTAFINADPARVKQYGDVLPSIATLYADLGTYREKQRVLGVLGMSGDYYGLAHTLYKWSIEKTKKDADREPGFMERDVENMKRGLREAQYTLEPKSDRKLLEYAVRRAMRLPAGQRLKGLDKNVPLSPGGDTAAAISTFVGGLYDRTKIGGADERMKMFDMSTSQLLALNDPFLNLARDLYDDNEDMVNRNKAFGGAVERLRPRYIEANMAWKKGSMYPDANGTIRLAYGDVTGYSPADAVNYRFITTLAGVVDKETGEEPFANPPALLEAYRSGDFGKYLDPSIGGVPVNFLTTDDGTGGNSGSPVMNGKGELIGLDFDSNWEGIIGDYYYDPVLKRSIVVDIRYVLYILDKVYHTQSLLDELTIH
jgi:hypothetical protein